MRFRFAAVLAAVVTSMVAAPGPRLTAGSQASAAKEQLPPLSYVCPMVQDAEVIDDKPGKCPKCGMNLEPIRLVSKHSCLTHPAVVQDGPGKCPIDKTDLIPVTLSIFWTCAGNDKHLMEPGACEGGQPRKVAYEPRPHGDHNPKHGGQFFMASDTWHHIEGTYPSPGLFRVYFYNDYSKPLEPKGFSGVVALLDEKDNELATVPLKPGRISNTMEAALQGVKLPLKAAAKIKFTATGKENRFDFQFPTTTKEPVVPVATTTRATPPPPAASAAPPAALPNAAPPAAAPAAPPAVAPPPPPVQNPAPPAATPPAGSATPDMGVPVALAEALDEASLPRGVPELLTVLTQRSQDVDQLIKEGNLASVWLPAMGTKTVALALETRVAQLPERQRLAAAAATKRVVLAAWQIDAYGDLGNKQKITEAYEQLAAAITELKTAYGASR